IDEDGVLNMIIQEEEPEPPSIDDIAYENLTYRDIFESSTIDMESYISDSIEGVEYSNYWLKGKTSTSASAYYRFNVNLDEGDEYAIIYECSSVRSRTGATAHPTSDVFGSKDIPSNGIYY